MTTRKELIDFANEHGSHTLLKLRSCNATFGRFVHNGKAYMVLKSYSTVVALYSESTGTLYAFNYYSATTCQHIHKFAHDCGAARITWLYRRSDRVVEYALKPYAITLQYNKLCLEGLIERDFAGLIETI